MNRVYHCMFLSLSTYIAYIFFFYKIKRTTINMYIPVVSIIELKLCIRESYEFIMTVLKILHRDQMY